MRNTEAEFLKTKKRNIINLILIFIFFIFLSFLFFFFYKKSTALLSPIDENDNKEDYKKDEVLIKFKEDKINLENFVSRERAKRIGHFYSLEKKEDLKEANISVFKIKDKKEVEKKIEELEKDPRVAYAQPNYIYRILTSPSVSLPLGGPVDPVNDPYFYKLWGLHNEGHIVNNIGGTPDADIDAPETWNITTGNANVVVAVIDTGVNYKHPDLENNIWINEDEIPNNNIDDDNNGYTDDIYGWNFYSGEEGWVKWPVIPNDPMDENGHGTHVAGIIGAQGNNNLGVVGVNWKTKIMALRIFSPYGWASTEDIIPAIDYAINNGAKIINASWGSNWFDRTLYEAIKRAKERGVLFVASAGNESNDNDGEWRAYPASYDLSNIISVAASDQNDRLTWFTNYGRINVDIAAPGENIYSTFLKRPSYPLWETFEDVTPPAVGTNFTHTGTPNYWGTIKIEEGYWEDIVLSSDYKYAYPYSSNANWSIESIDIDLSDPEIHFAYLSFNTKIEIGKGEKLTLSISQDRGVSWSELWKIQGPILSNWWSPSILSLSKYKGSIIRLKFNWQSDDFDNNYEGVLIDSIKVWSISSAETYGFASGTSMAAPHVAGVAALLWGYYSELDYLGVRNIILATGDGKPFNKPISTSKRINAYNALTYNPAIFNSQGGYYEANIIPGILVSREEIVRGREGIIAPERGKVTIPFVVKEEKPGLSLEIVNFQYSTDGGLTWKTPRNGDKSTSLDLEGDFVAGTAWHGTYNGGYNAGYNAGWQDAYSSRPAYTFNFYTHDPDLEGLNDQDQNDVHVRFKLRDGVTVSSDWVTTGNFRVYNIPPVKPTLYPPFFPFTERITITASVEENEEYSIYQIDGYAAPASLIRVWHGRTETAHPDYQYLLEPFQAVFSLKIKVFEDQINEFLLLAVDRWGNKSEPVYFTITEDSSPPVTTLSLTGTAGENEWYKSNVEVTIKAEDKFSPVISTKYRINEGLWKNYDGKFTLTESGEYLICYKSIDGFNHEEEEKVTKIRIDKEAPEIFDNYLYSEKVVHHPQKVKLYAFERISGLGILLYCLGKDCTPNEFYLGQDLVFDKIGDTILRYQATDMAGNQSSLRSIFIRIRKYDINGNGIVDIYDFSIMMAAWKKEGFNKADLNGNNIVDIYDFSILMAHWGK